ncbi:hypothetical protein D3C81_1311160 [compost metagenome]
MFWLPSPTVVTLPASVRNVALVIAVVLFPDKSNVLSDNAAVPAKALPASLPNENVWLPLDACSVPAPDRLLLNVKAPAVLAARVAPAAMLTPPDPRLLELSAAEPVTASVP